MILEALGEAVVHGLPDWKARWTVRATSSTMTAALTAARASFPIVNRPCPAISTGGASHASVLT
jgi:hypothetical protein